MTHIERSRRLQAGLAGLSLVSAVGAAFGIGLTTHTHSSTQASQGTTSTRTTTTSSHEGGEGNDDGGSSTTSTHRQRSTPVTQPSTTAPQATTSGS